MKKLVLSIVVSFTSVVLLAQTAPTTAPATAPAAPAAAPAADPNAAPEAAPLANPNSVRPINYADIMYQKTVWRKIDMREPQNRPFMARNRELSKIIIEALYANKMKAYRNDSLDEGGELTAQDVREKFSYNETVLTETGDDSTAARQYLFTDVAVIELRENRIFDRKRSLMYHDIQAVTLKIPGEYDKSGKGLDIQLASFKYKDLVEKVFKGDTRAKWFNRENDAEHKTFADAFELRLFGSFITKVSNPFDDAVTDIYGADKMGIMASQWVANELMEFEHNMWEF